MGILQKFDRETAKIIRRLPHRYRPAMADLGALGEPATVLTAGLVGFLTAVIRHQPAITRAFIFAGIAFGLNIALKLALHRRRPHGRDIETLGVPSYSFPSGHAFGTVIFYGLFAYIDIKYLAHPWDAIVAGLLILVILLVGLSRVYSEAHYPSDVLAGWLLGGVSLIIVLVAAF